MVVHAHDAASLVVTTFANAALIVLTLGKENVHTARSSLLLVQFIQPCCPMGFEYDWTEG